MTARERKAVAETLREWAAWCEASEWNPWFGYTGTRNMAAWSRAWDWCACRITQHDLYGQEAATGLCLAAAVVEAGDGV